MFLHAHSRDVYVQLLHFTVELCDALRERITSYHTELCTTTLLHDSSSHDWQNDKVFFEVYNPHTVTVFLDIYSSWLVAFVSPIPEQPTSLVGDCNKQEMRGFVLAGRLSEPSRLRSTLTVYKIVGLWHLIVELKVPGSPWETSLML